jgi:hypothetical protein
MPEIVKESLIGIPVVTNERQPLYTELRYPGKDMERTVPFIELVSQDPPSELHPEHVAAGLAAVFTTSIDNPFFRLPSKQDERNGAVPAAFAMYAPYYVGTGFTAEQIAVDVATQAAAYLHRLDAQHGYDGYVGRMLSVLRLGHVSRLGLQAIEDRNILYDVHDFLALITNRLHHIVPLVLVGAEPSSPAIAYRAETHARVDPYVETVAYQAMQGKLSEQFKLPEFVRSNPSELVALGWDFFKSKSLQRGAEFAALAAEKVGDPVIRESLEEHYIPAHRRAREYAARAY